MTCQKDNKLCYTRSSDLGLVKDTPGWPSPISHHASDPPWTSPSSSGVRLRLVTMFDFFWFAERYWFFPRASERRVLLIVGVCQPFSHLHIFTSSLHIFTSSLHIFSSSHLQILISSHQSSHIPSHLHFLFCPLALLPSCSLLLFYFSLKARDSANETARNATLSHETRFNRQKLR